ncbi:MAG TPA: cytochrome C oxidase subunit IV family protein [Nitrospirota bacterium]|nr:cytochrome C oxidase subunit IV family protein [Nitrospirota bacterium]
MNQKESPHIVGTRTFVFTWIALLLLTSLTIKVAEMQMGRLSMLVNLLIASTKACLVLWVFMHLKYERRIFKLLLIVPIGTITIIIGLTFFDIWYR